MTLLEVLIAFVIAALSLGALFRSGSNGLDAVAVAGRYDAAVSRAQSHLAAIGAGGAIAAGVQSGDDGGGYRYAVRIVPLAAVATGDATGIGAALSRPAVLYVVTVDLSWQIEGRTRHVVLRSERIGRAPPPPP